MSSDPNVIYLGCEPEGEPPWDELDDGIREAVRWLWSLGFQTTDSGDGRRQGVKAEMAEALDIPHVFMVCEPKDMIIEAAKLRDILLAHDLIGDTVILEATYFPLGGIGVIQLIGIDDAALAKAQTTEATP